MKYKIIFLLALIINFFSCSPSEDSSGSEIDERDTNSEFYVEPCDDFVEFDPYNDDFLLFLRSKGYDLNSDGKISCAEAQEIIDLDLGDTRFRNLKGIESFSNLKSIIGVLEGELNLYNNSNLEEVNFDYFKPSGNTVPVINKLILPADSKLKILNSPEIIIREVINIKSQTNLEQVYLYSITNNKMDLSNSKELNDLHINGQSLAEVLIGDNLELKKISISGSIDNIDLTGVPNIIGLTLIGDLTILDLSQNLKLKNINIINDLP